MLRAGDLPRGELCRLKISDLKGFKNNVFGADDILKRIQKLLEDDQCLINYVVEDGRQMLYFLSEEGKIIHDTMFLCDEDLSYVKIEQIKQICINEYSKNIEICDLKVGDKIVNIEGDVCEIYHVTNEYISVYNPLSGLTIYPFNSSRYMAFFCSKFPGFIFEQDDGSIIDDNDHRVTVFKNYKNRRQRPNSNNQFHSEFFEAVKLCAEMGNERLKKMAEEVNKNENEW